MGLDFKRSSRGNRRLGFYVILATTVAATIFVIATSDPARHTEGSATANDSDMSLFDGNGQPYISGDWRTRKQEQLTTPKPFV